jgi:beta-glucuronidase
MMPVPSSYNDITQDSKIRDHIGVVWYQKCEYLPKRFTDKSQRVMLHFGSVNYHATVVIFRKLTKLNS